MYCPACGGDHPVIYGSDGPLCTASPPSPPVRPLVDPIIGLQTLIQSFQRELKGQDFHSARMFVRHIILHEKNNLNVELQNKKTSFFNEYKENPVVKLELTLDALSKELETKNDLEQVIVKHVKSLIKNIQNTRFAEPNLPVICELVENYLAKFKARFDLNELAELTRKISTYNFNIEISQEFLKMAVNYFFDQASPQLNKAYELITGCRSLELFPEVILLQSLRGCLKSSPPDFKEAMDFITRNLTTINQVRSNQNTIAKKRFIEIVDIILKEAPTLGLLSAIEEKILFHCKESFLSNALTITANMTVISGGVYYGAGLGAAIGTGIFPGPGTVVGGILGGIVGAIAGMIGCAITKVVIFGALAVTDGICKKNEIDQRKVQLANKNVSDALDRLNFDKEPLQIEHIHLPPATSESAQVVATASLQPKKGSLAALRDARNKAAQYTASANGIPPQGSLADGPR